MQVKVCPKCGVENLPTFPVCRRCQTSLAQVVPMESAQTPQQQASGQYPNQPPIQQPPNNYAPPVQQQPYSQYSSPPAGQIPPAQTPYGTTVEQSQDGQQFIEFPHRSAWSITSVLGILVLIGLAVGVYYAWMRITAPKPRPAIPANQVVMGFLQAKATGDINKVRPYLSKDSLKMLAQTLSSRQAESAGFTRDDVNQMLIFGVEPTDKQLKGATVKITGFDDGNGKKDTATVTANVTIRHPLLGLMEGEYTYIVVIENGEWKIDLKKTTDEGTGGGVNPVVK